MIKVELIDHRHQMILNGNVFGSTNYKSARHSYISSYFNQLIDENSVNKKTESEVTSSPKCVSLIFNTVEVFVVSINLL